MSHDDKPKKVLLAVAVSGKWSRDRQERQAAAVASGSTSARMSKKTLVGLQELAQQLGELAGWPSWHPIPTTELLDWLASARIIAPEELGRACTAAIAEKHAAAGSGKSMHSRRPRKVHAGGVR